jgi:hypothetical protein
MTQTSSPPPAGSKSWRLGLRVTLGFLLLYAAILIVNLRKLGAQAPVQRLPKYQPA